MTKFTINPTFEERNATILRLHSQGHSVAAISAFVRTSTDVIFKVIGPKTEVGA